MKTPDGNRSDGSRWLRFMTALAALIGVAVLFWRWHSGSVQTPVRTDVVKPISFQHAAAPASVLTTPAVDEFGKGPYGYLLNSDIERAYHSAKKLQLSTAQLAYMQSRYNVFLDQEKRLEARVAVKESVKAGEALITIPPHSEEAKALYSLFETEMTDYLGTDQAADFFSECGQTIAMLNRDFGAQERLVLVDRNDSDNTYHIVDKTSWTTVPGLPKGVTAGPMTESLVSDLVINSDMFTYKYLAADFP